MIKVLKLAGAAAMALLLAACPKQDCEKMKTAVDTLCLAVGESATSCVSARAEYKDQCPVVIPPPPVTCPDGFPPYDGKCPTVCADLACEWGCEQKPSGAVCKPKPLNLCVNLPDLCNADSVCKDTELGPVCEPKPPVVCPEACPAGYSCADPAVGCVKDPVTPPPAAVYLDDDKLVLKPGDDGKQTWGVTWAALGRVKAAHPELFNAEQTGVLDLNVPGFGDDIDRVYALMAAELKPLEAGQSKSAAGQVSDCIFVQRGTSREFEEDHLFEYGGGKHATGPGAIKGVYVYGAAPPASSTCPAQPCPERVWTAETLPPGWGEDAIGKPRWHWNAKLHTMSNADSTPVLDRDEPYCRAIGLSPYADGTLRGTCPVRPDGHPEREAVENWLLEGGPVRDSRIGSGQDCTPNNTDNPFAFLANTGNCRICNTPKNVCSPWF